jgi:uncharacterized protein YecE (DUF72 family)
METQGIHVGTSGWTYDDWAGRFYPPDVKGAARLNYYAGKFDAVEVNASFYRIPTTAMVDAWNRKLAPGFHLVLKGPRTVTHLKKLRDCNKSLDSFFERALELRHLKVILWQLPPSFHRDSSRLDEFLSTLPGQVRHAVEFRHDSWWDDEVEKVLKRHSAAFVAVSHPRLPEEIIQTSDFLYIRFHGHGKDLYTYKYNDEELATWASRITPLLKGRSLYAFFNNDFNANAVNNAISFRNQMTAHALRKAV